jgi:parvulin-like peptidyl-prolyl isomerase
MAKREKKQRPPKLTRKYRSRVAEEKRQIRYIFIGVTVVVVLIVLLLLAGLYQTQVANPAATRQAEEALKTIPAATVGDEVISIAEWQARVRLQRQLLIGQAAQIGEQLQFIDTSSEFGQQLQAQAESQIQQIQSQLAQGIDIASGVLDQMVEEELIRQEAEDQGITVTSEEVQEFIEVNVFSYPYPPTPEPFPTLPAPTLPPTATVTPEPTLTPTPPPTPRSLEEFQANYSQYIQGLEDVTGMSEEQWRSMIESELYREKLLEDFAQEVETNVAQVQGSYIVAPDQETAEALLERLEAGESFASLVEEIQSDESEEPAARTGQFDWSPRDVIASRFGEEFATIAFSLDPGMHARVPIPSSTEESYYLVLVEGNETRELADYLVDQRQSEQFQEWLDQAKAEAEIEYGNWSAYVPMEPSLPEGFGF